MIGYDPFQARSVAQRRARASHPRKKWVGCAGLENLGCVRVGDLSDILNASGNLINQGVSTYEQRQASAASSAKAQANLQAAIAADSAAAHAMAEASFSKSLAGKGGNKDKANADAIAAQNALASDLAAASALAPEQAPDRVKAIQAQLNDATVSLQKDPSSGYAQALVQAWQTLLAQAEGISSTSASDSDGTKKSKGSFSPPSDGGSSAFKKVGIGIGVVGGVSLLGLAVKKLFFH